MFADSIFNFINKLLWAVAWKFEPVAGDININMAEKYSFSPQPTSGVAEILAITLGITVPFAALVLIVYFVMHHLRSISDTRAELIRKSLETGNPLPDEFYKPRHYNRNFNYKGMVWMAWGAGLCIFFLASNAWSVACLCLIPVFIGVAKIMTGRKNETQEQHPTHCPPPPYQR